MLPNLPSNIQYIFIVRSFGRSLVSLKSTRARRNHIQRALELLRLCDANGVWSHIMIRQDRLLAWPEDADVSSLPGSIIVHEVNEEGDLVSDTNNVATHLSSRNVSGNQDGPAALHNDAHVEHEYESLSSRDENSAANFANANLTRRAVDDFALHLLHPDPNPPHASLGPTSNSVKFNQPTVQQTSGFADMSKTPYAWARAFPTLFRPSYHLCEGKWRWSILHDITGWHRIREAKLDFKEWCQFQLWRSDGRAVAHATFKLATHNHRVKCYAYSQGRHSVKTSGIDPNTLTDDIRQAPNVSALNRAVDNIVNLSHHCAANQAGSKGYMTAKYHEMKAVNFCHSYMHKKRYNLFHTLSQAEFHEYSLRRVLSSYISNLDIDTDLHVEMMQDDTKFAVAVQLYPHVVTHYFATKTEIWLSLFTTELYGVKDASAAYEFSGGRGAIHTHLLALMENRAVEDWNDALKKLAGEHAPVIIYPSFFLSAHSMPLTLFTCWRPPLFLFIYLVFLCLTQCLPFLLASVHGQTQSIKLL